MLPNNSQFTITNPSFQNHKKLSTQQNNSKEWDTLINLKLYSSNINWVWEVKNL